ncbi:hypothetical protein OH77DRAFT_108485 [Trametes cingulata]|nr:hypothetical protein OH77DRAFT_108485 [Trametes cingulata]
MERPTLLSLRDDVLLAVLSFLEGQDALNFALACKRLLDLADSRSVVISSHTRLKQFYVDEWQATLLRVRYLERLEIKDEAIDCPNSTGSDSGSECEGEHSSAASDDIFDNDSELKAFVRIRDLFRFTTNLRSLSMPILEQLDAMFDIDLVKTVAALRNLEELSLAHVTDATLSQLWSMKASLVSLRLVYRHDPDGVGCKVTMHALLEVLAKQEGLHTLELRCFSPTDRPSLALAPTLSTSPYQLGSIRHLSMSVCSIRVLRDLVPLLPRLSTLSFSTRPSIARRRFEVGLPNQDNIGPAVPAEDTTAWPPLKRLHLAHIDEDTPNITQHLGELDRLQVSEAIPLEEWDPTSDGAPYSPGAYKIGLLLDLLRKTQPIRLHLSFSIDDWDSVAMVILQMLEVLPSLSMLELCLRPDVRAAGDEA